MDTALLTHRRTRGHISTPFMLSVSVADLWSSCFNLPVMATRFLSRDWMMTLGDRACQIYPLSFYGTMGASLLSLTLITVNRAFILFFPNKVDRIFSNTSIIKGHRIPVNSLLILGVCWLVPMSILLLPTFNQIGGVGLNPMTQSCTILKDEKGRTVKTVVYIVGFVIPLITLFITNLAMGMKVHKMRELAKRRTSFRPDEERRTEDRFIMMLGMVFLLFVLCYAPAMVVYFLDSCFAWPTLHIFTYIINWSSVVFNPLIYFFRNESYQAALSNLKSVGPMKYCFKQGDRLTVGGQQIPTFKCDTSSSYKNATSDDIKTESENEDNTLL